MAATLTRKRQTLIEEDAELTAQEIVRAWEDRHFRATLSPRQLLQLPGHPAGVGRLVSVLEDPHMNSSTQNGCASSDNCSSSNCSSSNCSSDNCSSSNCSSDNCSSSNCSGNLCSNWDCGGGSGQ